MKRFNPDWTPTHKLTLPGEGSILVEVYPRDSFRVSEVYTEKSEEATWLTNGARWWSVDDAVMPDGFLVEPLALTAKQFERAITLAGTHGHAWAAAWNRIESWLEDTGGGAEVVASYEDLLEAVDPQALLAELAGGSVRVESLLSLTRALATEGVPLGIAAPQLRLDCDVLFVHHVTGSGRLSWDIAPEGTVYLSVHRPGETGEGVEVLAASLSTVGNVHFEKSKGVVYPRHLDALLDALDALGCHAQPELVLNGRVEQAKPEPARSKLVEVVLSES